MSGMTHDTFMARIHAEALALFRARSLVAPEHSYFRGYWQGRADEYITQRGLIETDAVVLTGYALAEKMVERGEVVA